MRRRVVARQQLALETRDAHQPFDRGVGQQEPGRPRLDGPTVVAGRSRLAADRGLALEHDDFAPRRREFSRRVCRGETRDAGADDDDAHQRQHCREQLVAPARAAGPGLVSPSRMPYSTHDWTPPSRRDPRAGRSTRLGPSRHRAQRRSKNACSTVAGTSPASDATLPDWLLDPRRHLRLSAPRHAAARLRRQPGGGAPAPRGCAPQRGRGGVRGLAIPTGRAGGARRSHSRGDASLRARAAPLSLGARRARSATARRRWPGAHLREQARDLPPAGVGDPFRERRSSSKRSRRKQGSTRDFWHPSIVIERYTALSWSEDASSPPSAARRATDLGGLRRLGEPRVVAVDQIEALVHRDAERLAAAIGSLGPGGEQLLRLGGEGGNAVDERSTTSRRCSWKRTAISNALVKAERWNSRTRRWNSNTVGGT